MAIVLLLLAGGIVFLRSDYAAERVCSMVRTGLTAELNLPVTTGSCSIGLLPFSLTSRGLTVRGNDGGILLRIGRLAVEIDSLALLVGRIRVTRVRIEKPEIYLALHDGRIVDLPSFASAGGSESSAGSSLFPKRVEMTNGHIELQIEKKTKIRLDNVGLNATVGRESQFELALEVSGGSIESEFLHGGALQIDGLKLLGGWLNDEFRLDRLAISASGFGLEAHGSVKTDADPVPAIRLTSTVPLALLKKQLPLLPAVSGTAILEAETSRNASGLQMAGKLRIGQLGIAGAKDVDLRTDFTIGANSLDLANIEVASGKGSIAGKARLVLHDPWSFDGELAIEKIDLTELLAAIEVPKAPISLQAAGKIDFNGKGKGKNGPFVIATSNLKIDKFKVATGGEHAKIFGFGRASLRASTAITGRRLRLSSFVLTVGESRIEGNGKLYFKDGLASAEIEAPVLNLENFSFADLTVGGHGSASIQLGGSLAKPDLKLGIDLQEMSCESRLIGSLRGTLRWSADQLRIDNLAMAGRGGTVWLNGKLGTRQPYPLGLVADIGGGRISQVISLASGKPAPAWINGRIGGKIVATGTIASPALDFKLAFGDVHLGGQLFEEGGLVGRVENGAWHLDLFEARMGPGWLYARGDITSDLQLDLSAYSTGLRASSFRSLSALAGILDFRLDLHVSVKGPLRSPSFNGWAKSYDTYLRGEKMPDSTVSARATTEDVQIEGHFLGGETVLVTKAELRKDLPFAARLRFSTSRLGKFLPSLSAGAHRHGVASGVIEAHGLLLVPGKIESLLKIDKLSIESAGIRLANKTPIEIDLTGTNFEIGKCEIGGNRTEFHVEGGGDVLRGPRLDVEGVADLAILPTLFEFLPRAAGQVALKLSLGGPWSDLRLSGSLDFAADFLRIRGFSQDLSKVTGRLRIEPHTLEITRLDGTLGEGRFTGLGNLQLSENKLSDIALSFEIDRVRYNLNKKLWGRGTGTLSLKGPPEKLVLSGQVRILEGSFRERFSLDSLSRGIFRRHLASANVYSKEKEFLAFDLGLVIPGKFQLEYDLDLIKFQAEMRGNLRVCGTIERPGLTGDVEALNGSVNYLSKDFSIQSTHVQFSDCYSISPRVELLASLTETVQREEEKGGETEYHIDLHVTAESDAKPGISLKSDPPLDERDIVTLLTFGITSRDVEALKSEDLVGLGGEILSRSLKLDEKLRTVFPFPPEIIQPKYLRVRSRYSSSTGSERSGTISPRLEIGASLRFISDDLELDYGRSLYDDADQNLDLTYRLSKRVSARLRWENDAEQNSPLVNMGNLGLDLKFQWEW
jgi:translocation and assembly module TamB